MSWLFRRRAAGGNVKWEVEGLPSGALLAEFRATSLELRCADFLLRSLARGRGRYDCSTRPLLTTLYPSSESKGGEAGMMSCLFLMAGASAFAPPVAQTASNWNITLQVFEGTLQARAPR